MNQLNLISDSSVPQMNREGQIKLARVWVVTRHDYESTYPEKVFSTQSSAEAWVSIQSGEYGYTTEEFEVQP